MRSVRAQVLVVALILAMLLPSCSRSPNWIATGRHGMVACDHPAASRVGVDVLRSGGNAVDAAIAVSFALGVTRPYSTGLGGGGFMIVRLADTGRVFVLDYRETAPARASADMFVRAVSAGSSRSPPSISGHLAVAVPNLAAGLREAHNRWATKPLAELVAPAIALAEDGFPVDADYVEASAKALARYEKDPSLKTSCPYVFSTHLRSGELRAKGDLLRQPALARLLRLIGRDGLDVLTTGTVADAIEREMIAHGGIVSRADLAEPRVRQRTALHGTYRGYDIITMPPPSSGGLCLIEALNILETCDLPAIYRDDRVLASHYQIEAMKHAFADRARWMADPDFHPVPIDLLCSKVYAGQLARSLDPNNVCDIDTYGSMQIPTDAGTSHFCIIDRSGNCVVSTETINTRFGSLAAVDEWGLILNNEMDDFSAMPGQSNFYGLQQSVRNAPQPHKRPLSSMSPTIVLKDSSPVLLLGASGGPRIISSVLDVLSNVLDGRMSLEDAIAARRVHHQWQPDEVYFDGPPDNALRHGLAIRGQTISERRLTGVVQAIHVSGNKLIGASDPRKGGQPAGY